MGKLLVIGNGFDMSLNVKSSYRDYFESNHYSTTRKKVEFWISQVKEGINSKNKESVIVDDAITCWDIMFYIKSTNGNVLSRESGREINWCNIEMEIHDSLVPSTRKSFYWDKIYNKLSEYYPDSNTSGINNSNILSKSLIWYFICSDIDNEEFNKETFYHRLLIELNRFEESFGEYIRRETSNPDYKYRARHRISELSNNEGFEFYDTFNYSNVDMYTDDMRHINGDTEFPIFGIDAKEKEISKLPQIIQFTKTSRRMVHDARGVSQQNYNRNIKSVTVFGHSLNEQDYDYYVYIFSILKFNTFDVKEMGTIEFLFNVYDENKRSEITQMHTKAVYDLLTYYERLIRNDDQSVLINLLRFSGKLIIKEVLLRDAKLISADYF